MCRGGLFLAALLCFAACASAQQYKKYKEVPGLVKGEDGVWSLEHEGVTYNAYREEGQGIYFVNPATGEAAWSDPRAPPTAKRIDITMPPIGEPPVAAAGSSITLAFVALTPIVLFIGAMVGRIAYLQMYYPELLWPSKERKDRRRASGGKQKAQKQRGKLNQDGKGGRSANS